MLYLALILMGAASVVGYLQSEKAKERRKAREKREGRKMEKSLQFGSLKFEVPEDRLTEVRNSLALRDAIKFKLEESNARITGYKNGTEIGPVEKGYHKYDLLGQAIREGKHVAAKVNKLHLEDSATAHFVSITFEVS